MAEAKSVDAFPSLAEGGYSPMTGRDSTSFWVGADSGGMGERELCAKAPFLNAIIWKIPVDGVK